MTSECTTNLRKELLFQNYVLQLFGVNCHEAVEQVMRATAHDRRARLGSVKGMHCGENSGDGQPSVATD